MKGMSNNIDGQEFIFGIFGKKFDSGKKKKNKKQKLKRVRKNVVNKK